MKRIKALLAAFAVFLAFVFVVNIVCCSYSPNMEQKTFNTWYSPVKDRSYEALSANINKDTVMLMGSSEFRHGIRTPYHPFNMLAESQTELLSIGGPWNQTLFHTIAIGSLLPQMKGHKAILLVSPGWFKKEGVTDQAYSFRFSESEYYAFMNNPKISNGTKEYVAARSEKLLKANHIKLLEVKLANRIRTGESSGMIAEAVYRLNRYRTANKDRASVGLAMLAMKGSLTKKIPDNTLAKPTFTNMDWQEMQWRAMDSSFWHSDNPFDMNEKKWRSKYRKLYQRKNLVIDQAICDDSPEFGDLRAFLEVCRSGGIELKLIILPVNGKWYDYIGTTRDARSKVSGKIKEMAGEFGVETADLTSHEYDDFITRDAQHPWNLGWVLINEEIYKFCKSNPRGRS